MSCDCHMFSVAVEVSNTGCWRLEFCGCGHCYDNTSCCLLRYGETFDLKKHPQVLGSKLVLLAIQTCLSCAKSHLCPLGCLPQGTEVKAITFSNMQVYDEPERHEVYVIVDI